MATPTFIASRVKPKECLAVASWRESPSLKPAAGPVIGSNSNVLTPPQKPVAASDSTGKASAGGGSSSKLAAESGSASKDGKKPGGKRGRGKSKAVVEDAFDDFILRVALPDEVLPTDVLAHLKDTLKPTVIMNLGAPRVFSRKEENSLTAAASSSSAAAGALKPATVSPFQTPLVGPAVDNDSLGGLPEMALPPSMPTDQLHTKPLTCLFYPEMSHAEEAQKVLNGKYTELASEIHSRRRSHVNSSLVLKGLPLSLRCDHLAEELAKLPHPPSYVRLHRGDRGVWKGVVFVKYSNRTFAEHMKLELERCSVGNKPMRVEFKKKYQADASTKTSTDSMVTLVSLEQAVRDLRSSIEHDGFYYAKTQIGKEEQRYLKQLCTSYDLLFETSTDSVTVRKKAVAEKPSPALKAVTPPWQPATPGSLAPMEFRGIRHWKEMRSAQSGKLGFHRPVGPGDAKAFSAGRGRPVAAAADAASPTAAA